MHRTCVPYPCPMLVHGSRAESWLMSSAESGAAPHMMRRRDVRSYLLTSGFCIERGSFDCGPQTWRRIS